MLEARLGDLGTPGAPRVMRTKSAQMIDISMGDITILTQLLIDILEEMHPRLVVIDTLQR